MIVEPIEDCCTTDKVTMLAEGIHLLKDSEELRKHVAEVLVELATQRDALLEHNQLQASVFGETLKRKSADITNLSLGILQMADRVESVARRTRHSGLPLTANTLQRAVNLSRRVLTEGK
jgi:hypothetical protein